MVLSFNDVNDKFKEHGCILIMSEDEYNQKKSKNYKYKYIASCTHNNEICFSDFKNKLSGLKCPKCVNYESSINQIEKYKLNPVSPNDLEFESIEYLKTLIGDTFDVIINGEGCLADCSIKPKHIT